MAKELNIGSIIFGAILILLVAELTGKKDHVRAHQACHEWTEGASRAVVCMNRDHTTIYNSGGVALESIDAVIDSLSKEVFYSH